MPTPLQRARWPATRGRAQRMPAPVHLRALLSARRSAVKAHTAATNQIHRLLDKRPRERRDPATATTNTNALVQSGARAARHPQRGTTVAVLTGRTKR